MRNRSGVFRDRSDAGRVLARMILPDFEGEKDLFVVSIRMGGVPVALEISRALKCPMDLAIVRKIPIPGNTEAGFGAMTPEGDLLINEPLMAQLGLTEKDVEREYGKVSAELEKRSKRLRKGRPFPELENKNVILVDDGLASGFTMKACIAMVKRRKAGKIVLAVPTAPLGTIGMLAEVKGDTDAIYCANIRNVHSFAVAEAYRDWRDLSEPEVLRLLSDYRTEGHNTR